MEPIFHIASAVEWTMAAASGVYLQSTLDKTIAEEGFMHCSFAHQVEGVAQRYYQGVDTPLLLLTIDPSLVDAEIKVENGYPHIYGPLHTSAVVNVEPFSHA
jgi:glutathione S-transferase